MNFAYTIFENKKIRVMIGAWTCVEKNQDEKKLVSILVWLTGIKDK